MGETLFMLMYGSDAVLPIKVAIHTHRVTDFQTTLNNQALRDLLPLMEGAYIFIKKSLRLTWLASIIEKSRSIPWLLETWSYIRWRPLEKGLFRVSSPPIQRDRILYMKRSNPTPFVYKHFKALMFRGHGILTTYVGTMCRGHWKNDKLEAL